MKPNVDLIVLFFLFWNILRAIADKPHWIFALRSIIIGTNLFFFYYPINQLVFTLLFVLSILSVAATADYNKIRKTIDLPIIVDMTHAVSFFVLMILSAAGLLTSGSVTV